MDNSNIAIRGYRGGDEASLLTCWRLSMPCDPITEQVFIRKVLCDANFNPEGLVIAEGPGGEVAGFTLAITRRTPIFDANLNTADGWITAFATHPEWRRRGVGKVMFAQAERFLLAQGCRTISFANYSPHYFTPGIDTDRYPAGAAFLKAMGFREAASCVAMDISLSLFSVPADVRRLICRREEEGYRFAPLSPAYLIDTIQLAHTHFSPDWGRAARAAIATGIPFDQTLICIDPEDQVVGFCMFGAYDHAPDRFGPFGVLAAQRGKGLGKALLCLCLEAMRAKGLHDAWFLWTEENSPAGNLYKKVGFSVTRRFTIMRKQIDASA